MSVDTGGNLSNYLSRTSNLPAYDNYTIAGWFKLLSSTGGTQFWDLFGLSEGTDNGAVVFVADDMTLNHAQPPFADFPTEQTLSTDTWYYIAVTGDWFTGQCEVMWSEQGAVSMSTTGKMNGLASGAPDILMFGRSAFSEDAPNIRMAYLRVWDRALSASEILAERDSPVAVSTDALNMDVKLETNTDSNDQSGNGNHFTVNGTLTTSTDSPLDEGGTVVDAEGTSAGTSTANAVGRAIASAVGTASGAATVFGVPDTDATAVGAAAGTATVTGSGVAMVWAIGSAQGQAVVAGQYEPAAPEITDVDDDEIIEHGQTATFSGSDLGATTTDRAIELVQGTVAVEQAQISGNNAGGVFEVDIFGTSGDIRFGAATFRLTRTDAESDSIVITVNPPTGQFYADITNPDEEASNRFTAVPDIEAGDQLWIRGVGGGPAPKGLVVDNKGRFYFEEWATPESFEVAIGDINDATWGDFAVQNVGAEAEAVGTAAGSATVSGVGTAVLPAVGTSAASATATGAGKSVASALGTVSGSATAVAYSDAELSTGEASGAATVIGIGRSTHVVMGTASGVASVSAVSKAIAESVGVAAGTCTVTAISARRLPTTRQKIHISLVQRVKIAA